MTVMTVMSVVSMTAVSFVFSFMLRYSLPNETVSAPRKVSKPTIFLTILIFPPKHNSGYNNSGSETTFWIT